jgi:hypothetical protein
MSVWGSMAPSRFARFVCRGSGFVALSSGSRVMWRERSPAGVLVGCGSTVASVRAESSSRLGWGDGVAVVISLLMSDG